MADVVVVAKTDAATPEQIDTAIAGARKVNSRAPIVRGASPVRLDDPDAVRGRRVVEDGPTLIHGGMPWGAGYVAATRGGAGSIDAVLPARGYTESQRRDLARAIDDSSADVVVSGTPHDLAALLGVAKPVVRARYEYAETDTPGLWEEVEAYLRRRSATGA